MLTKNPDANPLVRKLEATVGLTEEERQAVAKLPLQISDTNADQDIVREGDRPSRCFAILEGFTCAYKIAAGGKRQILAFQIPGDIPDIQSLHLAVLDNGFATI